MTDPSSAASFFFETKVTVLGLASLCDIRQVVRGTGIGVLNNGSAEYPSVVEAQTPVGTTGYAPDQPKFADDGYGLSKDVPLERGTVWGVRTTQILPNGRQVVSWIDRPGIAVPVGMKAANKYADTIFKDRFIDLAQGSEDPYPHGEAGGGEEGHGETAYASFITCAQMVKRTGKPDAYFDAYYSPPDSATPAGAERDHLVGTGNDSDLEPVTGNKERDALGILAKGCVP